MKKTIVTIVSCIVLAFSANAQEETVTAKNTAHKQGYHFNVELGMGVDNQMYFSTSHGYNFGNGLFVGGGAQFMERWDNEWFDGTSKSITPVFGEVRYSLLNSLFSPYFDFRAGAAINITDENVGAMIVPSVGLDISCVSLGVGYTWITGKSQWNGLNISASVNF